MSENPQPPAPTKTKSPPIGLLAFALVVVVVAGFVVKAKCEMQRAMEAGASSSSGPCPDGTTRYANKCMTEDEISKKHEEERRAAASAPPRPTRPPTADDAERFMRDIENKVARDAVEQYEIAKRQGDPMMVCVQAGMVSAAWLQAKNEPEYKKWKDIEKDDCKKAGL